MATLTFARPSAPLIFRFSRNRDGAYVANDQTGRIGGVFTNLAGAIDFARSEAAYRKCRVEFKFDGGLTGTAQMRRSAAV